MSGLTVKVSIKQEVDAEEGLIWKAEVKEWGLKAQDRMLEGALMIMERKIVTYMHDSLGITRVITANMGFASARVEFNVEVEQNHKLCDFGVLSTPISTKAHLLYQRVLDYAESSGQDPEEVFQKLQDEAIKKGQITGAAVMNAVAEEVNKGKLDTPGCTVRATTHKAKGKGAAE
nr:hypothetical protein [uncultured Methanoregula sp.]